MTQHRGSEPDSAVRSARVCQVTSRVEGPSVDLTMVLTYWQTCANLVASSGLLLVWSVKGKK